jgi:hypothetical protein
VSRQSYPGTAAVPGFLFSRWGRTAIAKYFPNFVQSFLLVRQGIPNIYFVESGLFKGLAREKFGSPSRKISFGRNRVELYLKQHHTAEGAFRPDFVRDGGARLIEVEAISVPWQERRSFLLHARTLRNLRRLSVVDSAGRRGFNPNGGGVA